MADDEFSLWLGRIGNDRPTAHQLRRSVNLAGGKARSSVARAPRFDGSRIGRGSGIGRMLAPSDRFSGFRARRVVVKARFVKLAGKGARAAVAHMRYLQRDGTTREGERGTLYAADRDVADGKAFLERGAGDRHQFRFIVAPEDGAEYADLKPLVRRWMNQVEQDLGTKLDWVAVDHFNTGHPHSHVLLRGVDEHGQDLIIAREYISRGLAARAAELVNLDLGPRTDREIFVARQREITQERFTGIDRKLLLAREPDGLASAWHRDGAEQSLRAARLGTLARMGLATEAGRGRYRLADDLEPTLRAMGRRGDIIATMHEQLKRRTPDVPPHDYAIYDPAGGKPLIGRVVARGLADEHRDRHYMIVAATDGRSHYVELGARSLAETLDHPEIVAVKPVVPAVRDADRTIAAVAADNNGLYSVDAHLRHDPSAVERFVEAHVRRLEALRRRDGVAERRPDGSWAIAPDHLDRVLASEQRAAMARPVEIELLSDQPLDNLMRHDGLTWLDERDRGAADKLERGFGAELRKALALRRQWLIEQGLAWEEDGAVRFKPGMIDTLRQRELRQVAGQLSNELGLDYAEHRGGPIDGIYRKPVQVGSSRFALIEKSKEFTLVPWRPVLDRQIGRYVSGIQRGATISWTFGRQRTGSGDRRVLSVTNRVAAAPDRLCRQIRAPPTMGAMQTSKTRHQFYLPDDLSAKLDAMAARPGSSKTAILTDALTAWFDRRAAHELDERFGIRLDRQSRTADRTEQKLDYLTEALGLFIRHQLTLTAHQPTFDAETQRLGRLRYDEFVKLVGRLLARSSAERPSSAPPALSTDQK